MRDLYAVNGKVSFDYCEYSTCVSRSDVESGASLFASTFFLCAFRKVKIAMRMAKIV